MDFFRILRRSQIGQKIKLLSVATKRPNAPADCMVDFITKNGHELTIGVTVEALQDFKQLQKYIFVLHGIWIRHRCEKANSDRKAARIWSDEVGDAVAVGAGK